MLVILIALEVSVLVNAIFFAFAAFLRTDKVTDLSYSLSFIAVAVVLLINGGSYSVQQVVVTVMICIWGVRLGSYLFARVLKTGVDHRFDGIRDNLFRFARFWILQALTVWVVMLPSVVLLSKPLVDPIGWVSFVGFALWAAGFGVEAASDWQKSVFKSDPANWRSFISTGLWRYSRHPNYFGETLAWWGLFVAALPAYSGWDFLTVVGPVSLTLLLLFVTGVPLLEKSAEKKYGADPEYQEYKKRTSMFLLLPPRK